MVRDLAAGAGHEVIVADAVATLRQTLAVTYRHSYVRDLLPPVRHFLEYASARALPLEQVKTEDVADYLRTATPRKREMNHGAWRQRQVVAINHLLRAVAPLAPHVADPNLAHPIVGQYFRWLRDVAGFSPATVATSCGAARRFLQWCDGHELPIQALTVQELDAYVASWPASLQRSSRAQAIGRLKAFIRYLAAEGAVPRELSLALKRPIVYAMESIPVVLDTRQIAQVCAATKQDCSPKGRRDYAILLMLAAYGCRPGEITALRLEHVAWRKEMIALPRPKTHTTTSLPLLPQVGSALVDYLRNGRPASSAREVFLRVHQPFTGLATGSTVSGIVRQRLIAAGLEVLKRCGAYGFRHEVALDLLRAGYPRAVVGDVLGHRKEQTTHWYLKLPTEDLRDVCLALPEAEPCPGGTRVIYPLYRRRQHDLDVAYAPQRRGRIPGTPALPLIAGTDFEALISEYVRGRREWASSTQVVVQSVLRCYCRSALMLDRENPFSLPALQAWLVSLAQSARLGFVARRAHAVDHFLAWWTDRAGRPNPFDELRTTMGGQPLIRAIAAIARPEVGCSLEALRPRPRFRSHLAGIIVGHVERMRSLGFKYHDQRYRAFDTFVSSYPGASQCDFAHLAQDYVSDATSPSQRLRRTSVVRALANALSRVGHSTRPLAWDPHVDRMTRASRRRPVILSEEAVRHFLGACERLPSPLAPLRPSTLKAMGGLAYCAGLRLGELVRLRVGDVDLRSGTLDVRETKFFKSRRLPLHASVTAMLRDYLTKRRATGAPSDPETPLFWSERRRAGYTLSGAEEPLTACLAAAGLRAGDRMSWARPHDLRHTCVVHRLTRWYNDGVNPQNHLPYLATYLGHRDINSTLVYITVTRELLQQACDRLRPLLVRPFVAGSKE